MRKISMEELVFGFRLLGLCSFSIMKVAGYLLLL